MSRFETLTGGVLALCLLSPCSYSAETATFPERLTAFRDRIDAIAIGKVTIALNDSDRDRIPTRFTDQDRMIFKALVEFEPTVGDKDLEAVASFAVSKDGASVRCLLAHLLVDRGRFDAAAKVVLFDLVADPENRSYRLWKWWEWNYSDRKNYKELSRSFCDALLGQFDTANAETKLAVSELFGKGEKEAKMPLQQFKDSIHYDRRVESKNSR
jgi:hypothetical protein